MKRILFGLVLSTLMLSCSYDDGPARSETQKSERVYYKGPKGGCFYWNENGKKVHVKNKY